MASFTVDLNTWNGFEIPDLAQLVKQYAAEIGVTINLKITDDADVLRRRRVRQIDLARLGDGHHRLRPPAGAERLPLVRSHEQGRRWNAAHFKNAQADSSIGRYIAALDLDSQRVAAKQIQELLLDETPVVVPVLLQLPLGRQAESAERGLGRHRPVRPLEGRLHQLNEDEAMRPELRLRPHSL